MSSCTSAAIGSLGPEARRKLSVTFYLREISAHQLVSFRGPYLHELHEIHVRQSCAAWQPSVDSLCLNLFRAVSDKSKQLTIANFGQRLMTTHIVYEDVTSHGHIVMQHHQATSTVTMTHCRVARIRTGKQGSLFQESAATRPVTSPIIRLHRMHRMAVAA